MKFVVSPIYPFSLSPLSPSFSFCFSRTQQSTTGFSGCGYMELLLYWERCWWFVVVNPIVYTNKHGPCFAQTNVIVYCHLPLCKPCRPIHTKHSRITQIEREMWNDYAFTNSNKIMCRTFIHINISSSQTVLCRRAAVGAVFGEANEKQSNEIGVAWIVQPFWCTM